MIKKAIEVIAKHKTNGAVVPIKIIWEDGRTFDIVRIKDIRRSYSRETGAGGIRYRCIIENKEKDLYFDDFKWFIEIEK